MLCCWLPGDSRLGDQGRGDQDGVRELSMGEEPAPAGIQGQGGQNNVQRRQADTEFLVLG
jgi:hypothetical protein